MADQEQQEEMDSLYTDLTEYLGSVAENPTKQMLKGLTRAAFDVGMAAGENDDHDAYDEVERLLDEIIGED